MTQALFKGGSRVLFLGVETYNWTDAQFVDAAQFAQQHGFTGVALKCADGGEIWYGGYDGIAAKVTLIEKTLPVLLYTYAYADEVPQCTAILAQLLERFGGAICDMEVEFNNQIAAATAFEQAMRPVAGVLYVTTWSDIKEQDWTNVVNALAPCTNGWIPQEYNNFLEQCANSEYPSGLTIYPAIDITQEFGANDPVQIAKDSLARGEAALFVWEYAPATQNTALVDQISAAFTGGDVTQQDLQTKLTTLEEAYNKVVAEKNALIGEKNDLTTKLTTLQDAWNKIVPEKNDLIGQVNQLKQQLASNTLPTIVKNDITILESAFTKLKTDSGL